MPTSLLVLEHGIKIESLEEHIDDLLKQKGLLEDIEHYSNDRIDFGDVLETYNLLVHEIERLQKQLREQRQNLSGERGVTGEGVMPSSGFGGVR